MAAVNAVRHRLPEDIEQAVRIGEKYWNGLATERELVEARAVAWRWIDTHKKTSDESQVTSVELAINALFPRWQKGHLFEVLHATVEIAEQAGIALEVIRTWILEHFGQVVDGANAAG